MTDRNLVDMLERVRAILLQNAIDRTTRSVDVLIRRTPDGNGRSGNIAVKYHYTLSHVNVCEGNRGSDTVPAVHLTP